MARGLVSLLSIFLLSATAPTGLYAFTCSPSLIIGHTSAAVDFSARRKPSRATAHDAQRTIGLTMISKKQPLFLDPEDRLREEGVGGSGRARLAESIAEEFRVRVGEVRQTYDVRLEQERAAHRLEMAEQRVKLLEGMVPLAAHEAVVESYEKSSAAALKQTAVSNAVGLSAIAGDFSRRQEALRAQVEERDTSLRRASSDLRGMSDSLDGLKRDVTSLREALGSHATRAAEVRRTIELEIRANEVEPQRRRADVAETDLSELRQAAHGWFSAAHALKLEATAEARAIGNTEGLVQGRLEGEVGAETEIRSLEAELLAARKAFSDQLVRSCQERLALREEVLEARNEAVEMVAAVGTAGAVALTKSREVWMTEARAEGFAAGLAQRLAERSAVVEHVDAGEAVAATAAAEARVAEAELRKAFAAYIVSAHEQKLRMAASAKESSAEVARGLSEELAGAHEMLAKLLKERISEMEARRDSALSDVAAASTAADANVPLRLPEVAPWPAAAATNVATDAVKTATSSPFWQECGGGQ